MNEIQSKIFESPKIGDIVITKNPVALVKHDFYMSKKYDGMSAKEIPTKEWVQNIKTFNSNEAFTILNVTEAEDQTYYSLDCHITPSWYVTLLHKSGKWILYAKNDINESNFYKLFKNIKD